MSLTKPTRVRRRRRALTSAAYAAFWLTAALSLSGCATLLYQQTQPGQLRGKLIVEWYKPDKFLVIPDRDDPLRFIRANGERIVPGLLYTDSARVPRSQWLKKQYSPWGYTPAFAIHDWLLEMNQCRFTGYQRYDLETSATVMAEVVKTLMQDPLYGGRNDLTLYDLYQTVRSPAAYRQWRDGVCDSLLLRVGDGAPVDGAPLARYVIQF